MTDPITMPTQTDAAPPSPTEDRLTAAITGLTRSITELVWLTAENRTAATDEIALLRARRHQLSAVIDRLRATGRGP